MRPSSSITSLIVDFFKIPEYRWFIPPPLREGDEDRLRQARTVVWFTPMAIVFYSWSGLDLLILPVTISGLAIATCPLIIRWTGSSRQASNVALISCIASVTFVAALTGGGSSPILWWLTALPFIAGNILGDRGCVTSCTASVTVTVFFFAFLPNELSGTHSENAQNAHHAMPASTFLKRLTESKAISSEWRPPTFEGPSVKSQHLHCRKRRPRPRRNP